MALISITANDIDAAGTTVDAELPLAWLEGELTDTDVRALAPGHVTARLSRTGTEIVVRGRARASLTLPCSRCLEPARVDVEGELSLLLRPAKGTGDAKHAHKEYEFGADEADHDTYDGETVVLDTFVREALLLEVPNFPLCSEACAGIGAPASPGADATERAGSAPLDPRLAPLSALRDKLAKQSSTKGRGSKPPPKPAPSKKNKE